MNKINETILLYKIYSYEKCLDLVRSGKPLEFWDNYDISKIFEYFFCIKWMQEKKQICHQYDHIHPDIKEDQDMSQNDTGIDCSNLTDMIAQCKLRDKSLTWTDCSTFIASQISFDEKTNKNIIKWDNLVLARNSESKLATNLLKKKKLFTDLTYDRSDIIEFCQHLLDNPPLYPKSKHLLKFKLRDYQIESINLIKNNNQNVMICIPTGGGKNIIMIYSMQEGCKYLILVPRIILMEQLKQEIIDHKPELKNEIQMIGDSYNKFLINKKITICVFNSVGIINDHVDKFDKIFIDEAHHVMIPEIYTIDNTGSEQIEANEANEDDEFAENEQNVEDEQFVENEENIDNEENNNNQNYEDIDDIEENQDIENNVEYQDNEDNEDNDDNQDIEDIVDIVDIQNIEDIEDDEDFLDNVENDEVEIKKNYLQIIRSFKQYNNNVYLSATIDEHQGFKYYKKDIREMIDKKYLCDYVIKVPIFTDDPTNQNICEYLIEHYRNVIIYCHSKKEGIAINKIFNKLMPKSCEYIDCDTPKKKRDLIIERYKKGTLPYLVNIRVLVEGFNSPITKCVCFIHLPSSKTSIIQIIGRALRVHPMKTVANVILPFSSKRDETSINKFLKIMARNDTRIKKSFETRKLGGYISLDEIDCNINDDVIFRYDMVYDSMGVLQNRQEMWNIKRDLLFEYSNHKKHVPPKNLEYKGYNIGFFLTNQKIIITDNKHELYNKLAENQYVKESMDKYLHTKSKNKYLIKLSQDEFIELFFEYCDKNKTTPTRSIVYKNKNLGFWYNDQKKKISIADNDLYKILSKNKYAKNSLDLSIKEKQKEKNKNFNQDEWINLLFVFCEEKNRTPYQTEIFQERKLGYWYNDQKKIIRNINDDLYEKICKNKYIKNDLNCLFIKRKKNKGKIKLNYDEWKKLLFEYCDEFDKIPLSKVVYNNQNIGEWFKSQKKRMMRGCKEAYINISSNDCVKEHLDLYLEDKNKGFKIYR